MKDDEISDQPVGSWLADLASAAPAPGGGAAAALNVAIGASLVEMVCNLTIGKPRYAEHEATMTGALEEAGRLRRRALDLAGEDARAFAAVSAAYQLPKDTDAGRFARRAAIQAALVGAAEVPLHTADAAAGVIGLAGLILEGANVNVISDVAVAASSARAGMEAAAVNVEINLGAMADSPDRAEVAGKLAAHEDVPAAADRIVAEVRQRISS